MPCYHPIPAWRARHVNQETGRRPISFSINDAFKDMPLEVPCGRCVGCRLAKAQAWAIRCRHESLDHKDNSFVTLTYDENNLPEGASLNIDDLQRFWKRLRKAGHDVRYFACGEYGDLTQRPHYHACIFGYWPGDAKRLPSNKPHASFTSEQLARIWGHGNVLVQNLTQGNAGYVAQYTLKKYTEKGEPIDFGERLPPFLVMSRRPGLGINYAREHAKAITHFDGIRQKGGTLAKIPRYYETVIEKEQPVLMKGLKAHRKAKAIHDPDNTGPRLIVREKVKQAATQHNTQRNNNL